MTLNGNAVGLEGVAVFPSVQSAVTLRHRDLDRKSKSLDWVEGFFFLPHVIMCLNVTLDGEMKCE